jgi:hypothetical protein
MLRQSIASKKRKRSHLTTRKPRTRQNAIFNARIVLYQYAADGFFQNCAVLKLGGNYTDERNVSPKFESILC